MYNEKARYLFDCEICDKAVTEDDIGYCVENNFCDECQDELAFECMSGNYHGVDTVRSRRNGRKA